MTSLSYGAGESPIVDNGIDPIPQEMAFDTPVEQPQVITLDRDAMLAELHGWCTNFIKASADWRRSSYEDNWRRWQRDADAIYDPDLKKKKEPWQSCAVWPLSASHRENAQAQLFKTEVGPRPPIDVKARKGIVPVNIPQADQSENIKDLVLREREKSEYEINRNDVLEDKTTYGSGFAQVFFETKIEDRLVQEAIFEDIVTPDVDGGASIQRSLAGQKQVIGYKPTIKPQVIYRGIRFRHISIWDVFPDPKSLKIQGNAVGLRYYTTYGEIVDGAKPTPEGNPGYVLPEAVDKLRGVASSETTTTDKQAVQTDRMIAESMVTRPDYGRRLECFEIQARLPKKWVLIDGQEIDDPEELIPARVRFHSASMISVLLNDSYDGEPDLYKDDYMPVAGSFYGRGIPEMLKDPQAVATEFVNMRLDNGKVSLLNTYAVIEKCLVDPKDLNVGPGSGIRLKARDGLTNIDQMFQKIDQGSMDRAAFMDPQEWERAAQERTSITQTTLGTEDNANTTLGALKIQQGVTGLKIAYLGMLSEFGFQRQVFRAYWKNIYSNYQPEDYAMAIGPERAQTMVPLSPEQVENGYQYYPLGIFEMESKAQRQAGLANWAAQFAAYPWSNIVENAREQARSMDIEPEKLILEEAEAIQITTKAEQMAQGMAQQLHAEMMAKDKTAPGKPPAKEGAIP